MPARNSGGLAVPAGAGALAPRRPAARRPRSAAGTGEAESGLKRAHFDDWRLPFWLLAPQLFILLLFFFIPSVRALLQAFQLTDPFGATTQWVGFQNFERLFRSGVYWSSVQVTLAFTLAQNILTLSAALVLAFATNHIARGRAPIAPFCCCPMRSRRRSPASCWPSCSIRGSARSRSCCRGWASTGTRTGTPAMLWR